jgi:DNA-binding NtrC family response regulator
MMTAYPSMNSAIESMRDGVFDYIIKPFKIAELADIINQAIVEYRSRARSEYESKSAGMEYK